MKNETLFVLSLQSWSEGNFGDLEIGWKYILGVFSSLESAKRESANIKLCTIKAQFGTGKEKIEITECALDDVTLIEAYNTKFEKDNESEIE